MGLSRILRFILPVERTFVHGLVSDETGIHKHCYYYATVTSLYNNGVKSTIKAVCTSGQRGSSPTDLAFHRTFTS